MVGLIVPLQSNNLIITSHLDALQLSIILSSPSGTSAKDGLLSAIPCQDESDDVDDDDDDEHDEDDDDDDEDDDDDDDDDQV